MTVNRLVTMATVVTLCVVATTIIPWNATSPQAIAATTNPTVKPGDVTWHTNFEAACSASKTSGKPVLLFQLLGNLDQEFC